MPEEVRQTAPAIPWTKMIGMRHILVHNYFQIDAEIVWDVVEGVLPGLKRSLQALLDKLEPHSAGEHDLGI